MGGVGVLGVLAATARLGSVSMALATLKYVFEGRTFAGEQHDEILGDTWDRGSGV
jgi:hypothetical protein